MERGTAARDIAHTFLLLLLRLRRNDTTNDQRPTTRHAYMQRAGGCERSGSRRRRR
jgi:hypothetical protein